MTLATPFLILSLLSAGSGATTDVVRVYDLRPLAQQEVEYQTSNSLLPLVAAYLNDQSEGWDAEEEWDVDTLVWLVTSVMGDEFEYEGREYEVGPDGKLVVRGPEALHERIGALLEFLETVLTAEARIVVDSFRFEDSAHAVRTGASSGTVAQADSWIENFASGAEHSRYTIQVRADRPAGIDLSRRRPLLYGYEAKVATGMAAQEPHLASATLGTRLQMRASPGPGGMYLALELLRGELLAEPSVRENPVGGLLRVDGGLREFHAAKVYQEWSLLNRSASLNTFLADGRALILETVVDLARGSAHEVLILRKAEGALLEAAQLPLDARGGVLSVINLEGSRPARSFNGGRLLQKGVLATGLSTPWDGLEAWPQLSAGLTAPERDFAYQWIERRADDAQCSDYGPWAFVFPDQAAGSTQAENEARSEALDETQRALQADTGLLDVQVSLRRTDGDVTSVRARIPLRVGDTASLALGIEDFGLRAYNVEIADSASTAEPRFETDFDGLAIWMRATRSPSGAIELCVRGGAQLLRGERKSLDLHTEVLGAVDMSVYDHLSFDERVTLRTGRARQTLVLGQSSPSPGLRLVIEVTDSASPR